MGFLANISNWFKDDKINHINDLRATIGEQKNLIEEYKTIIEQLREENKIQKVELSELKAQIKDFFNNKVYDVSKEEKNPNKPLKLSKKEQKVYDLYEQKKPKDIEQLSKLIKMPIEHLRVYKSRIIKKGYNLNFEFENQ